MNWTKKQLIIAFIFVLFAIIVVSAILGGWSAS